MTNKSVLILMVVVAVVSAGITRYYFPQVELKNTETVKEVVRNDIRTIVKEVVRPDGTKETVTETTDKSTKKETSTSELIVAAKKQWMIDIAARKTLTGTELYYDLQIQRRILGPFFAGIKGSTDKSVGVSIGMEF
jgi:Na+-translocating ferredoxin:NAD+ oxidoreductase RnfG subunit